MPIVGSPARVGFSSEPGRAQLPCGSCEVLVLRKNHVVRHARVVTMYGSCERDFNHMLNKQSKWRTSEDRASITKISI